MNRPPDEKQNRPACCASCQLDMSPLLFAAAAATAAEIAVAIESAWAGGQSGASISVGAANHASEKGGELCDTKLTQEIHSVLIKHKQRERERLRQLEAERLRRERERERVQANLPRLIPCRASSRVVESGQTRATPARWKLLRVRAPLAGRRWFAASRRSIGLRGSWKRERERELELPEFFRPVKLAPKQRYAQCCRRRRRRS